MGLMLSLATTAAILSIIPCLALMSYTLFRHPTRFILQTFVLIPVLLVASLVVTAIGGIIKYLSFNLISEQYRIYIGLQLYRVFGLVCSLSIQLLFHYVLVDPITFCMYRRYNYCLSSGRISDIPYPPTVHSVRTRSKT